MKIVRRITLRKIKTGISLLVISLAFNSCSSLSTQRFFAVSPQENIKTQTGGVSPCGGPSVGRFNRSIAFLEGEGVTMRINPSWKNMSRINFIGPFYFSVVPVFFFGYSGKTDFLQVRLDIETQKPIDIDFRQVRLQTPMEVLLPVKVENGWGAEKTAIDMNQRFHMEPGEHPFLISFNSYLSRLKEFELLFDGFSSAPLSHEKIKFSQDSQTVFCVFP